jgi:hypothetical protein
MRGAAGGCVLAERRVGGAVAARGLLCVRELGVGAGGGADEERQQAEEGDCEMQRLLHPFFHLFIPAPLDAGSRGMGAASLPGRFWDASLLDAGCGIRDKGELRVGAGEHIASINLIRIRAE